MIKAVLWSRLAMMRDNIRNTHTQAFVGEGVSGWNTPGLGYKIWSKTSSQRLMLHYTRLFIRLLYIKEDSYATVHSSFR